jgi:nifR3 family TIM-barrel protein
VQLGALTIEHPFVLAPMAGITNSPYRRLMRQEGSAAVVSELVSANGLEYGNKKTQELFHFHPSERPVGLQIFGEHPELLVRACQHVEKLGADFVDLNLGCPVRKVVVKGAGCALTREPEKLFPILQAMVASVKIPVTIKIRTGWDEGSINADEVIDAATKAGVNWVAIHGRTRAQSYEGHADWELIARLKENAKIPILGNGDVTTPEIAVKRYRESKVDAILIGRGALRNPFIFRQSQQLLREGSYDLPTKEDYLNLLSSQKRFLSEHPNPRSALLQSQKFIAWYAVGFPHCHSLRRELFEIKDFDQIWVRALEYFDKYLSERDMSFLSEGFLMGGHG